MEESVSATIHWQPVSRSDHTVPASLKSKFIEALGHIAGSLPTVLTAEHIPALGAMSLLGEEEACKTLIDAIASHGEVRVWATY
jgi:hypothetical protein